MISPRRIVSLLPSATEMLFAMGLGDRVVGRSHECDYPPEAAGLPVCSSARFGSDGSSAEIDRQVKDHVAQALSLYEVDEALVGSLEPDLIVTQTQCEVCAVSLRDVEAAACRMAGRAAPVVSLEGADLAGVWADVERLGAACGEASAGKRLADALRAEVTAIREGLPSAPRPTVACIEWMEPLMAAGNWVPDLVRAGGGTPLFAEAGDHAPWLEWDALLAADPDVVLLIPCGFSIARTLEERAVLERNGRWAQLRAVREGRVFVADANRFFSRPGPRLVDSIRMVGEMLHPGSCSPECDAGIERWRRF